MAWWGDLSHEPIAVRSSAIGEDSDEHSYAGQNQSFLNIQSESELKEAVERCFESIHGEASKTYRHFFDQKPSGHAQMNVVIQLMVKPKFSGVFFSRDPRGHSSTWIIELIEGLGEDLVSGRKKLPTLLRLKIVLGLQFQDLIHSTLKKFYISESA